MQKCNFPQWLLNPALYGAGREGSQGEKQLQIQRSLAWPFQRVASTCLNLFHVTRVHDCYIVKY